MIYHNKLNQLLIANQKRYLQRQDSAGPGGKICPVCQGENKECRYFQPLADTGSQSDFSIENSQQWEDGQDQRVLRLAAVKEKLLGNILTVSDYEGQYTLDLGKNLIVAKRYLDLDSPAKVYLGEISLDPEERTAMLLADTHRIPEQPLIIPLNYRNPEMSDFLNLKFPLILDKFKNILDEYVTSRIFYRPVKTAPYRQRSYRSQVYPYLSISGWGEADRE